jgi:hypothetical protein
VAWGGNAFPIMSIAGQPANGSLNQAMFVPSGGLPLTGGG